MYRLVPLLILGLFLVSLTDCAGGEDGSAVDGSTVGASLTWSPIEHHTAVSYTVHFAKQSSVEGGACHYENSLDVTEPFATVTGLEPDTLYYFAVSAYDGRRRSFCSNEVLRITPAKDRQKPCKHTSQAKKCNSAENP